MYPILDTRVGAFLSYKKSSLSPMKKTLINVMIISVSEFVNK